MNKRNRYERKYCDLIFMNKFKLFKIEVKKEEQSKVKP